MEEGKGEELLAATVGAIHTAEAAVAAAQRAAGAASDRLDLARLRLREQQVGVGWWEMLKGSMRACRGAKPSCAHPPPFRLASHHCIIA